MNKIPGLKEIINNRPLLLLGMGSELRGDDGWAYYFITQLKKGLPPDINTIWASTGPENFLSPAAKLSPKEILLLDAGNFDEPPGTVKLFNYNEISDYEIMMTHRIPVNILGAMLHDRCGCAVHVLLMQPANLEFSLTISETARDAVKKLLAEFKSLI